MKKKNPDSFCGIVYVTLVSTSRFLYAVTPKLICFFAFLDFEPLWLNNNIILSFMGCIRVIRIKKKPQESYIKNKISFAAVSWPKLPV